MRTLTFKILFSAVILFLTSVSYGATLKSCDEALSEISITDNLIAYLSDLFKEGVLTIDDLFHFDAQLEKNNIVTNPFGKKGSVGSAYFVHAQSIDDYLNQYATVLNKNKLKEWAQKIQQEQRKTRRSKEKSGKDTKEITFKMNFHEMPTGEFLVGDTHISIKIEQPFAMMDTLVTQWMWVELKKIKYAEATNPSKNNKGEATRNHPVEQISWDDAKKFIDDLNELSSSSDLNTQEALRRVISQHQPGDVYDFPSIKQTVAVRTDMGKNKKISYKDESILDKSIAEKYYWTGYNSGFQTHIVADRLPEVVNNHEFYDLAGNVFIFTKDQAEEILKYKKEVPIRKSMPNEPEYVILGGGHANPPSSMGVLDFMHVPAADALDKFGLRLVRYRK